MTFEEIGRREHISAATAESLFNNGMHKLRTLLPLPVQHEGKELLRQLDQPRLEYSIAIP
jgi:hypothetical protein